MKVLTTVLLLAICTHTMALEVHVSPKGNDRNPGTAAKPLGTLEAARDLVRAEKRVGGATIILHEGRYFRDKTFELDERDSGTAKEPVVYRAAPGATVFIDGGRVVPNRACTPVVDKPALDRLVPGFEPIPFGKIGLRVDTYRAALPVSAPVVMPPSQVFLKSVEVRLTSSVKDSSRGDVVVHYTTDGSDPDATDAVARGPLTLKGATRLKARAFVTSTASIRPSPIVSAVYEKTDKLYLSLISEVEASAHQGLKKNINYAGSGPVALGGKTFSSSLMACPARPDGRAHVTYALRGPLSGVKRFLAEVGVDDAMSGRGSVIFIVEVKRDGKWTQVFKSPVLRGGRGSASVDVDIAGADAIRLVTTDGGDNIDADHAVWGGARVE